MLASAIEKQDAWAAPMSCSGLDPGPSSKRDLYVTPPLMPWPAVNAPDPVGMSPLQFACAFETGMCPPESSSVSVRLKHPPTGHSPRLRQACPRGAISPRNRAGPRKSQEESVSSRHYAGGAGGRRGPDRFGVDEDEFDVPQALAAGAADLGLAGGVGPRREEDFGLVRFAVHSGRLVAGGGHGVLDQHRELVEGFARDRLPGCPTRPAWPRCRRGPGRAG